MDIQSILESANAGTWPKHADPLVGTAQSTAPDLPRIVQCLAGAPRTYFMSVGRFSLSRVERKRGSPRIGSKAL